METTVQEFLASYSPQVRDLAWKLRALVLEVVPNAIEQVDPPDRLIGYGLGLTMADTICVIAPYTSHVNVLFGKGTSLPDPDGLLQSTGKRARHVKIKTANDIEAPALRALLEAAVAAHHS